MQEDTLMEDDEFNIDQKDNKVWLVKVPKFLAEKWNEMEEAGIELGTIQISSKTTASGKKMEPTVSLTLPETDWSQQVPKNYTLKFTNASPKNEFVFTEADRPIGFAGKIEHEATVNPVIDDDYRRMMQLRTAEASTSNRVVQMMDTKKTKNRHILASATVEKWDVTKKKPLEKRERMPRQDLISLLFAEFEKYPYWTFKGLQERTQQPQQYLKEVLGEVCILNKSGPYAGKYQLKSEYAE